MKIALNTLSAREGGGVSVLTNLLACLVQIDRKNSYIIFYSPRQREFVNVMPENFRKVEVNYLPDNPFVRVLWEQMIFPFYLFWHRIDVLYSVGNITSLLAPCKVVLLVENANPYSKINIPLSFHEHLRNTLLLFLGKLSAYRATRIRFVSQSSKMLIAPQLNIAEKKCVVIPHGVSDDWFRKEKTDTNRDGILKNYILAIGANAPHRNIHRLINAFFILKTRYNYPGDLLVLGCIRSSHYKILLEDLVDDLSLRGKVFFKGEISKREVRSYLAHTDILVFPSVEETFGLPLIEAMALGTPIVASDCNLDLENRGKCFNPFREICQDAAHYFNPFDVDDMARQIARVLSDYVYQQTLIAHGRERVKQYDLNYTTHALVKLWGEAAGQNK